MSNTWSLGRTGKVFAKAESAYGTAPTFAATNALRHLNITLPFNPKNRVWSKTRFTDPSYRTRFTRRQSGGFDVLAYLFPSGTLNTLPEADVLLLNGLGAVANTTLATTVSASPAPTTTGATVASATGLAAGQFVQIAIAAGGSAGVYARMLTDVTGSALTWAPALPAAPATGDTVKGCATYSLATDLPASIDIAHYNGWKNREQLGCVLDKLVLTLDANEEPQLQVSGPAQGYAAAPQAAPGTFTTVGAETVIPSGLTGSLTVGAVSLEFLKFVLEINNGMDLQNNAFGTSKASAFYRKSRRLVNVSIETMVNSQTTLYDAAVAVSDQVLLAQCGTTSGGIIAIYVPAAEFEVPDTPDSDETNNWSFKGVAKGSAGNDEVRIGLL